MRRVQALQTVTFLLLLVALIAGGWQIRQNRHVAREGRQAHEALCVLKADLAQRIRSGHDFLNAFPNGIPGVPVATIRTSIANQEATLRALRVLTCPKPDSKGAQS